jgi:aminodeoxyfutalosine deaminase
MYNVTPFIAALPKVELHLHLVGSASTETVLELARRHPDSGVPTEAEELAKFYRFTDFQHFIQNYILVDSMVRTADDVRAIVLGLARDAAASNVRYAEVTVTVSMHLAKGITPDELAAALTEGRAAAQQHHGVTLNWIYDIPAGLGDEFIDPTVDFAIMSRPLGTVALGLAGMEHEFPRARYREYFEKARAEGLHSVVHAGEVTGPSEVWAAVRELGAERIGHGIGSASDGELLNYLRDNGITLEICPTSNLCTRAVELVDAHPLPRMLSAGVPITLSTDDPGMFATDLNTEYALASEVFGLNEPELAQVARTGIEASYCDDEMRSALLRELDEVSATARPARQPGR